MIHKIIETSVPPKRARGRDFLSLAVMTKVGGEWVHADGDSRSVSVPVVAGDLDRARVRLTGALKKSWKRWFPKGPDFAMSMRNGVPFLIEN